MGERDKEQIYIKGCHGSSDHTSPDYINCPSTMTKAPPFHSQNRLGWKTNSRLTFTLKKIKDSNE